MASFFQDRNSHGSPSSVSFYRLSALTDAQPTVSKHSRQLLLLKEIVSAFVSKLFVDPS